MPLFSQGGPLSFTGGFVKLNILLPPVSAVAVWAIQAFCKSKLAVAAWLELTQPQALARLPLTA